MKILTKDAAGDPNGHVIPVWNVNERPELRPDQVYVTAVAAHSHKGPHLHKIRRGLFCCIKGNVRVVMRIAAGSISAETIMAHSVSKGEIDRGAIPCERINAAAVVPRNGHIYLTNFSGDDHGHALIEVPTGVAACIYNDGDEEALMLNMPSPAWSKDAPDEWPVENWNP